MELTWRWFGPTDKITLSMLKQIGVQGIVTALHDVPTGEVWTREAINTLNSYIKNHGLRWSVVESLPVPEAIKYGGPDRDRLIDNYRQSMRNLAAEGIYTVCYNFMPVLDWARTDLAYPNENGTTSLHFSHAEFAYFDIYLLKRDGATNDYSTETLQQAETLKSQATPETDKRLIENIIVKTQGFVNGNISESDKEPVILFRKLLERYQGIHKKHLRENLRYFLEAVMPVCEETGVNLCVHPDDPPFPILGLPRIVTGKEDITWLLNCANNKHNGLTFCAGSLSAGLHNDVTELANMFANRTHFVHLRSCNVEPNGDFTEASHLGGRADVIELARIFERTNPELPVRVDHGPTMLGDESRGYNAGYSFLGRMFAMGQLQGVLAAVNHKH